MSTTLKVLSADKAIATHHVSKGNPLVIKAGDKINYQLIDDQTGFGPQNIIAKHEGNDLKIFLEDGDMNPDIIIEGYYGNAENPEEVTNLIVGQAENGNIYAYVPESGAKPDAISLLAEEVAAPQALGGNELASAFWVFNPWWLLALVPLAGIAIAAGHHSSGGGSSSNNTPVDNTSDKPTLDAKDDGSVTVTPGADNTKTVITYTDEDGNNHTVTVTKEDGKWKANDNNVTVDPDTGVVTIPADKVKDGSQVDAKGSDDNGNTADADPVNAKDNPDTTSDKPTLDANDDGSVTVTPGADNTKTEITYTDEDGNEHTVIVNKDENGKWTTDDDNIKVDPDTGIVTIPADKVKDGSQVDAKGTDDKGNTADADPVNAKDNPDTTSDKPTLDANDDGSVTVTPGADNTKTEITYTDEDGNEHTVVVNKDENGKWTTDDSNVNVDPDTGVVTIPADKVKDGSQVDAKGYDDNGNTADADPVNAKDNPDTTADAPTGLEFSL